MTNKRTIGIAASLAVSVLSTLAADDATALRSELDALTKRFEELEVKSASAKKSWADKIKLKGDIRYRYEYKEKDGDTNKNRHRIRARIGAYAQVNDQIKAGIRLASGSNESPTSTNQTIGEYASKKQIWLDRAYLTYSPVQIKGLSATAGKMAQPWVQISDLMFDGDVNPEGLSADYKFGSDALALKAVVAYHLMDENLGDDVGLISGQLSATSKVSEDIKLLFGLGAYSYSSIEGDTPAGLGGNTSDGSGNYLYGYDIVNAFLKANIDKGPIPFYVYAEYLNNIANDVDEGTAYVAGIGAKINKFGIDYSYRDLESDSVLGYLADGDFGGAGVKGHKLKLKYSILKNWSAGIALFGITDVNDVDSALAQVDLAVKF